MAITVPTEYDTWQGRSGEIDNTIVLLTNGGTTWTVGNFESGNGWNGDHIYNLITKDVTVRQTLDPIGHDPSRAIVNITLSNSPDYKDGVRISDELTNIVGHSAAIYHMNSPHATNLNDCALLFSGSTQSISNYDEKSIKLELADNGFIFDEKVLSDTLNDFVPTDYPSDGVDTRNKFKKAPIVYGVYKQGETGLAFGWMATDKNFRFVIANHFLDKLFSLWLPLGSDVSPVKMEGFQGKQTDPPEHIYAWPIKNAYGKYLGTRNFTLNTNLNAPFVKQDGQEKAVDPLKKDTKAIFKEVFNRTTNTSPHRHSYDSTMIFEIDEAKLFEDFANLSLDSTIFVNYSNFRLNPDLSVWRPDLAVVTPLSNITDNDFGRLYITMTGNIYNFYDEISGRIGSNIRGTFVPGSTRGLMSNDPKYFDYNRGMLNIRNDTAETTNRPWAFGLSISLVNAENHPLLVPFGWVSDVFLSIQFEFRDLVQQFKIKQEVKKLNLKKPGSATIPSFASDGVGLNADHAWFELNGRQYSFDVWNGYKNANGKMPFSNQPQINVNKVIEESSAIIASLLVDTIGVNTADIDWAGFSDNIEYIIRSRYNIFEDDVIVKDVIKDLCDQGMFTYAWTASGKMRLIPLRTTLTARQSASLLVKYDDISDKIIKISKSNVDEVINHITVKSKWLEEENRFADLDVYENTTSQAQYGVRKKELEFKNITSGDRERIVTNPVKAVMLHLIEPDVVNGVTDSNHSVDDGYWANQRNQIEFTLVGSVGKHLDIGDYILMDSTSIDQHLKIFGQSWAGKYFLVTGINKSSKGTKINAEQINSRYSLFDLRGGRLGAP